MNGRFVIRQPITATEEDAPRRKIMSTTFQWRDPKTIPRRGQTQEERDVELYGKFVFDGDKPLRPPRYSGPVCIDYAGTDVKVVGEELHPAYWIGRQWAVTEYGLECRNGQYHIEAHRLNENWVQHMNEKGWVDMGDFITALCVAKGFHQAPDLAFLTKKGVEVYE